MKNQLTLLLFCFFSTSIVFAQSGTEFWFAPPEVTFSHNSPGGVPIYLNISTFNDAATVTIDQPANLAFTPIVLSLGPNVSHQEDLTAFVADLETAPTNTILNTGLRIVATDTITAYYEVSNSNNADIFSLKGNSSLGKEFYIPLHKHEAFWNHDTYSVPNLAYASFDIVATQNNTTVIIYSPVDVDGIPALTPHTVVLQQGETYSCANTDQTLEFDPYRGSNEPIYSIPSNHPSGAVVISDKDIAITIKDDSNHNPSGGCYDLLGDQIVPVGIVGTEYIAVKGQLNATGDESVFILATQNNTEVYIDGATTPTTTLFAGQTYRYDMDYLATSTDNSVYIVTSKPAYVTHVTGFGCEEGQAVLPPLGCAGSEQISIIRSTSEPFYLNIMVRTGSENNFTVTGPGTGTINGTSFQAVPGTAGTWMAAQIQYNTAEIPVNQAHLITNTSDVFTLAIVNGGAATGCRYGFFSEFAAEILLDPGPDITICANDTAQLTASISGGTTTGVWSTSGSGQFLPDPTDLNATYVPSPADISAGSTTLFLTSTGNCTPVQDQLTLNFTPAPTVDAGVDEIACENNPAVNLNGAVTISSGGIWSGGAGTFAPNNTSLTTTYTPTAAEISSGVVNLVLESTGNGTCNPEFDGIEITFSDSPVVDAGVNQSACVNNPDITLGGSVTIATGGQWSGGAGTFSPNVNALNAVYTPTAGEISTGSVVLTLSSIGNGDCNVESDNVTLTYTPEPVVNAGPDQTKCANNADITLNGSVTIATGGIWTGGLGIFTPNNSALNAVYTPTVSEIASGNITLTLTSTGNDNCNPVTDDVDITFTAAPTVDAGVDIDVCANNPDAALTGTVTIASGGVWLGGSGSFSPGNNSLSTTYTPTATEITAGSVTLTLETTGNGNCLAETDDMIITINQDPISNAGPNLTSCVNNPNVNLAGSVQNATGGVWSGGSGTYSIATTDLNAVYTPSASEITAGTATLTLTTTGNGSCQAATDMMTISITDSPTVNAGPDQTLCGNNADVSLNGTVLIATGGQWSGGLGVFTPNNNTLNAVYTPSATEIASGSVTLTLTSTGNGQCNPETDNITINFTPAPVADAGLDINVCENNSDASLAGTVSVATGGVWTGGAGTFSTSSTDLSAVYSPSSSEILAGIATLTLTTTGVGNCNTESDDVDIIINAAPTVNAGADQTICVDNLTLILSGSVSGITNTGIWTTSGSGTFVPNNTSLNAAYIASAADSINGSISLTLTSTNNMSCLAVDDVMNISILPAGFADAGSDQTVCANNSNITLNGGISGGAVTGVWSTTGTGVFTPNDSTLNASYIPSAFDIANGTVDLILTANSCNAGSDNMTVTITPAPVVDAGADITVCATDLDIPLIGLVNGANTTGVWGTLGTGGFSPSNTSLNATYNASSADSVNQSVTLYLTSTNVGNCIAVTDSINVNIFPTGVANAGADQTLCSNNADALMNGAITGGATAGIWSTSGSGVFVPSNTDLNATYIPSLGDVTLGSVDLILTATNSCNVATDFMSIAFTASPVVDAGPELSICGTNPSIAVNGSVSNAVGGVWTTTGSGTFSPSATNLSMTYNASAADIANGGVFLYLTSTGNGNCNPVYDSTFVAISNGISVDAGVDQQVCSTADFALLQGLVTNGSVSGVWSTLGTGTFSPNDSLLTVEYHFSAADTTVGSVILVLTSTNNGSCVAETDTVELTFGNSVFTNAGTDQIVCADDGLVNLSGFVSGGSITGEWQSLGSGIFNPSDTVLNAIYIPSPTDSINGYVDLVLNSTNNGGCAPGTDTVQIIIEPVPLINVGANKSICANTDSIALSAILTNVTSGVWTSSGSGQFSPSADSANVYYIPSAIDISNGTFMLAYSSTSAVSCANKTDTLTVNIIEPLIVGFENDETCENMPMLFNDTTQVLTGSITDWLWEFGDGDSSQSQNPIHIYDENGIYEVKLTVTSSLGCIDSEFKSIIIKAGPVADFNYTPLSPSIDQEITFTTQSSGATEHSWDFGDGTTVITTPNTTHTYPTAGTYTVEYFVSNSEGCSDTITKIIDVNEDLVYPPAVPSGFSPNNDGENDMLLVRGGPFTEIELKVYNNWGNLIFESEDVEVGWDGTWKNKLMPVGDYIYSVKAVTIDGESYSFTGSVSIIK